MQIAGQGGRLAVGYQTAQHFGPWTLTQTHRGPLATYQVTAVVVAHDAFWSQQQPLTLVLTMGQREWIWTGIAPVLTPESLTATLTGGPVIH